MGKKRNEIASHYIVELSECNPDSIKYVDNVQSAMTSSVRYSNAKVLGSIFYQFKPFGVSGVIIISDSHFAIHTWPEHNYVALDILTCGEMHAENAINSLQQSFSARRVEFKEIQRGYQFQE